MISSIINKKNLLAFISSLLLPVVATSCKDDLNMDGPALSDGAVRIGAGVTGMNGTRDYISDGYGPVTSGTFTISYPYYYSDIPTIYGGFRYLYQYGVVTFGYSGQETTGFVNAANPSTDPPKDLVWSRVNNSTNDGIYIRGSLPNAILFLDNIPKKNNTSAADSTVNFTSADYSNLPFYKAGRYAEDGSNDLLWGKAEPAKNDQFIHFDLKHCLSRFRLNVVVEESDHSLGLSLDHASVKITDLKLNAEKFYKNEGILTFADNVKTEDFYLVGWENGIRPSDQNPQDSPSTTWKGEPEIMDENTRTYSTYDFIIPPQNLNTGIDRQKLIIRIPKEDFNSDTDNSYQDKDSVTFWAYMPSSMYVVGDNGEVSNTSLGLNFNAGYDLTLTTKMKPGEPELEFMPVLVEQWVNVGEFPPKADENGIRTPEEFYKMMTYYEPDYNAFQLTRYGYLSGNTWRFQIQKEGLKFEQTEIAGKMIATKGQPGFIIDFRNRPQVLILPDGRVYDLARSTVGQQQIYVVLTTPPNSGVTTSPMFTTGYTSSTTNGNITVPGLIQAYQSVGNAWALGIYGEYNDESKQWTFSVNEDITLDYFDIVYQMPLAGEDPINFKFNIKEGVTVTLTNAPNGTSSTLTGTDGASTLYQIVTTKPTGIVDVEDFNNLISAYTANNTANLNKYGNNAGGTWTFPIWRNISLTESQIQGSMKGSNYNFNLQRYKVTINQADGNSYDKTTSADLVKVLNLNKCQGIGSQTAFLQLKQYYQDAVPDGGSDNFSTYGYFCLSNNSWVFRITGDITLNLADIEGCMVPATGSGQPNYSFDLGAYTITVEEEDGSENTYEGEEGAQALYEITSNVATNRSRMLSRSRLYESKTSKRFTR